MTSGVPRRLAGLTVLALAASLRSGAAMQAQPRPPAPVRPGAIGVTVVIKSQHHRLSFTQDIQRIAVGDTEILSADLITNREVLVLGRETGKRSMRLQQKGRRLTLARQ